MGNDDPFLEDARSIYERANARALEWLLSRPPLNGVWLNTKLNSISLRDYDDEDGWRGPKVTYGWIQGRGLEALARHAQHFHGSRPALAARLDAAARPLYRELARLWERDGHAYFAYDEGLRPVFPAADNSLHAQRSAGDLYTYSDIFVLKGLLAAAARFEPEVAPRYARALAEVARAVESGRFLMNERCEIVPAAVLAEPDDYGPRMILLGAAALMRDSGYPEEAAFGRGFIAHVLEHHVSGGEGPLPPGTTRDVPGGDTCNAGHAIEFAGFAFEYLGPEAGRLADSLETVLLASFRLAFESPGVRLRVSLSGREPPSPYRPWWSLPETIRTSALAYAATRNPESMRVWQQAHDAFFKHFWREDPPIAYQTLTEAGPVDYVPATPDLDPAYHTGLSFLGAIRAFSRTGAEASP